MRPDGAEFVQRGRSPMGQSLAEVEALAAHQKEELDKAKTLLKQKGIPFGSESADD